VRWRPGRNCLNFSSHLLLESTDSAGNTEIIDTGSTLNVVAAVVSLSAAFDPNASNVLSRGAFVTIANSGNVDSISKFTAVIGLSTDAAGRNIVATGVGLVRPAVVRIRPSHTVRVRVTGWDVVRATLPAGLYFLTLTLTDVNTGKTLFLVGPQTT
jgi:hypothetical protein